MFKGKKLYVGLAVVGVLVLLGAVSVAYAQGIRPASGGQYFTQSTQWPRPPLDESCEPRLFGAHGLLGGPLGQFGSAWTTMFDGVAEALGLSPTELFTELHEGKSVAEVAEAQDVALEDLRDALEEARVEARKQATEEAVEQGRLPEDQAEWMQEGLDKGFIRGRRDFGHGGGLRPGHRGRMRGMGW